MYLYLLPDVCWEDNIKIDHQDVPERPVRESDGCLIVGPRAPPQQDLPPPHQPIT